MPSAWKSRKFVTTWGSSFWTLIVEAMTNGAWLTGPGVALAPVAVLGSTDDPARADDPAAADEPALVDALGAAVLVVDPPPATTRIAPAASARRRWRGGA